MALVVPYGWAEDEVLGVSKLNDMSFGTIDFDGSTGIGDVALGSNGGIGYGGNTSGNGMGTPAQMLITGPVGTTVTISCSQSGSLMRGGGTALSLSPVVFRIGAGYTGPFATDTVCAGLGVTVATHTIGTDAADNTLFVGGKLAVHSQPLSSGAYGAGQGGVLPSFQLLVQ